jgi:hypothetical protein
MRLTSRCGTCMPTFSIAFSESSYSPCHFATQLAGPPHPSPTARTTAYSVQRTSSGNNQSGRVKFFAGVTTLPYHQRARHRHTSEKKSTVLYIPSVLFGNTPTSAKEGDPSIPATTHKPYRVARTPVLWFTCRSNPLSDSISAATAIPCDPGTRCLAKGYLASKIVARGVGSGEKPPCFSPPLDLHLSKWGGLR